MIPVSDKVRQRLLQAVESELEQLQIEEKMPQVDSMMTDEEYVTAISEFKVIKQDLLDNRLVVFDMKPKCTFDGCEAEGRYSPIIFVFLPGADTPCAQLDVQPVQWCCTQHANGRIDNYLSKPQWRDIQTQMQKQTKTLIRFGDVKIMYMDKETQTIVPPPVPAIVLVDNKPGVVN